MIFPASYYTWPQIIMHIQNKGLFDFKVNIMQIIYKLCGTQGQVPCPTISLIDENMPICLLSKLLPFSTF